LRRDSDSNWAETSPARKVRQVDLNKVNFKKCSRVRKIPIYVETSASPFGNWSKTLVSDFIDPSLYVFD
jgi:hypothetical protein